MQQFANYTANWLQERYNYHTNWTNHVKTVEMASTPWNPAKYDAHWVRWSCQPGDVFQGPQIKNPHIATRDGCGAFSSAPTEDTTTCYYIMNDACGGMKRPWQWSEYCAYGKHTCVFDVMNPPRGECCSGYQPGTCVKTSYRGRKEQASRKLAANLKTILDKEGLPSIIRNLRSLAQRGLPVEAQNVFQRNGYPRSSCVFSSSVSGGRQTWHSQSVKQSVLKGDAYLAAHRLEL